MIGLIPNITAVAVVRHGVLRLCRPLECPRQDLNLGPSD
jgi:hypothetical protein